MQKENDGFQNGMAYEAPKCEIIEVQNEGVLCGSLDSYGSSNESFTESDWGGNWDKN